MLRSGKIRAEAPEKRSRRRQNEDTMSDDDITGDTLEATLTVSHDGMSEEVTVDQTDPRMRTMVRGLKEATEELRRHKERLEEKEAELTRARSEQIRRETRNPEWEDINNRASEAERMAAEMRYRAEELQQQNEELRRRAMTTEHRIPHGGNSFMDLAQMKVMQPDFEFSGKPNECVSEFIFSVESYKSDYGLGDADMIRLMGRLLKGSAAMWYRSEKKHTRLADILKGLRLYFEPDIDHRSVKIHLEERKQSGNESAKDYAEYIRRQALQGNLTENEMIKYFIRGSFQSLRAHLETKHYDSLNEAVQEAMIFEKKEKRFLKSVMRYDTDIKDLQNKFDNFKAEITGSVYSMADTNQAKQNKGNGDEVMQKLHSIESRMSGQQQQTTQPTAAQQPDMNTLLEAIKDIKTPQTQTPKQETNNMDCIVNPILQELKNMNNAWRYNPQYNNTQQMPSNYSMQTQEQKTSQNNRPRRDPATSKCYNCDQIGHFARNCTVQKPTQVSEAGQNRNNGPLLCNYCPIRGHATEDCRWKKRGHLPPRCDNCRRWGHIASACRQPKN